MIFPENLTIQQIDEDVKPIFENITGDAEIQSQKVADSNEVILKTRVLSVDEREQVAADLQEAYGMEEKDIAFETISSTVSSEMRRDAVIAVVIAAVCMLIYIWIRFHDIRFATSAVLALLHDVLVVFACYALVRISVGNTFIACMLTILGYSINATIVIFDRIRENLVLLKGRALAEIVNTSITETLTRSIYTSLTTFITIAVLFLLGVSTIREFALPLMVGILAGAYSSVCLTGVIWYLMRGGERKSGFMKEKWFIAAKKADFKGIAERFCIDPVTARIIRNRDIVGDEAIRQYLKGSLADLPDPESLKDCGKAAKILRDKILDGKKIRIIGDYDIDGVNASYILWKGLKRCGAQVDCEIPDRMKDGYGLNLSLIQYALEEGIDTILTCDNGISALEQIAYAKVHDMTVIVTDHHEPLFAEESVPEVYEGAEKISREGKDLSDSQGGRCGKSQASGLSLPL